MHPAHPLGREAGRVRAWCRAQSWQAGEEQARWAPRAHRLPSSLPSSAEALPATPAEGQGHRQAAQSQQGTHNSPPGVRAKCGDPCGSLTNGQTTEVMSRDPITDHRPHQDPRISHPRRPAEGGQPTASACFTWPENSLYTLRGQKKKKTFTTGEKDMKLTYQQTQSLTGSPVCLPNNSKAEWL